MSYLQDPLPTWYKMDLLPTIEDDDDITIIEEESDTEDDKKVKIFIILIGI